MYLISIFLLMICVVLIKTSSIYYLFFYFVICFFLYRRYNFKKVLILIFVVSSLWSLCIHPKNVVLPDVLTGRVGLIKESNYILHTNYGKVRIYSDHIDLKSGNKITVKIEQTNIPTIHNLGSFNFKKYSYSQKIYSQASEVEIIENDQKLNWLGYLNDSINRLKYPKVISYSRQLILGVGSKDNEDIMTIGKDLSLLHLFSLSGMHLFILEKFLKKLGIQNDKIRLIILGLYTLTISYLISLVRAYMMLCLQYLFKNHLSSLERLSITGIIFLLWNPYIVYSLSFIFSFTIYAFLVLTKNFKHSSIYPFLSGIPIVLSTNYSISLFALVYIWLIGPVVEGIYIFVLLNILTLNIAGGILNVVIMIFENMMKVLSFTNIELIFSKPGPIFIVVFYCLLLYIIYQKQLHFKTTKASVYLVCLLALLYFKPYYNFTSEVTMIDVGQGDSILIRLPFNQGNYLIDTGGNKNTDLPSKITVPFLKSIGVKSLDALIITHDDFDHNGEMTELLDQFKVKRVIEQKESIGRLQNLDIELNSDKKNDHSLVYYLQLNGLGYLFTGDLPAAGEKQIIEKYPNLKIDVLKVGHHGSLTSTSNELLSYYRPKYAFISVGKNNRYHHPHPKVVDRLNAYGVKIFRTDECGMIRCIGFPWTNQIEIVQKVENTDSTTIDIGKR